MKPYFISVTRSRLWHKVVDEHISGPNHVVVITACKGVDAFKHECQVSTDKPDAGRYCYNCRRTEYGSDGKKGIS